MVHVGATDAPVTIDETEEVMDEMADNGIESCDLLGWEWEMGLHDTITERARRRGLDLRPRQIPREVMERQVTDADAVRFFELAHVDLDVRRQGHEACVVLKDFAIPSEELIPPKVREQHRVVVGPDRLLVGRLRLQRRGLPQPVAGLSDARGAGARDAERLARVPGGRALRDRREDHRHLRQRHDQARRGPHQVSDVAAPSPLGDPYAVPERRKPSEGTYVVNGVRARVDAWRAQGYPGASATSRRLLGFWFADEHRFDDGRPFRFYFCQREAVETFIYLTEIEPVRGLKDLLEFAEHGMTIQPGEPKRQRLAMKMATGSGKTMAMSLCIVWSYFHALYEADSPMTTSFLVVAPNVIVFERLKSDFGDAATFRRDPLVPPEWSHDFDLTVLLQDDPAPVTARGVLYLTNVQRLYEPSAAQGKAKTAPNPVEAMLGPRVNRDVESSSAEELFDRIADRRRVMVVNDEAHHVHDEKLKWNQTIERLHDELRTPNARRPRRRRRLAARLLGDPQVREGRRLPPRRGRLPARASRRRRDRQDAR